MLQLTPYDETHSGFQKFIDLLKTSDVCCGLLYLSCNECEKEKKIGQFYVKLLYMLCIAKNSNYISLFLVLWVELFCLYNNCYAETRKKINSKYAYLSIHAPIAYVLTRHFR